MALGGITAESLEDALSDFNCEFGGDEDFVEKMNTLSYQFHLNAEDLIDEVITHANNVKKSMLDVTFLDHFEQQYNKKKVAPPASATKKRTVLADLKTTATPCSPRAAPMEIDDEMSSQILLPKIECRDVPNYLSDFTVQPSAQGPGWFHNRADSGKIVAKHGSGNVKIVGQKTPVNIIVMQGKSATDKRSYADDKAANVLEGLDGRLRAYAQDVRTTHADMMGDAPFASLNTASDSAIFIVGFVMEFDARCHDISTIVLMADEEDGAATVTVDVTALEERCFFPGEMVVLRGVNKSGRLFDASERLAAPALPARVVKRHEGDATIWIASGPFTPQTTVTYEPLAEVIQMCKLEAPNVLVLVGPLVDRKSEFMIKRDCPLTDTELTMRLLKQIQIKMKGSSTRIFFVPSSSRDSAVIPVFPRATFLDDDIKSNEVVDIVSDPFVFTIGGAEIAVTASEVLSHISRAECHYSANKENVDRLKRVAGHLIEQRSLYPLDPAGISVSREGIINQCTLTTTQPHIIVAPTIMAPFVKSTLGCMVANPGTMCRSLSAGTVLKMRLALSEIPDNGTSDMSNYTHINIARI